MFEQEPTGTIFLHEETLAAAGRAVANKGGVRFPDDLLELFNLIEAVCLKERFLIPSLVERRLPDNEIVAVLSDVNGLLAPVTISAALVHDEEQFKRAVERSYERQRLIADLKRAESWSDVFIDHRPTPAKYYFDRHRGDLVMTEEYRRHIEYFGSLTDGLLAEEIGRLPFVPPIHHLSGYIDSLGLGATVVLYAEWDRVYRALERELKASKVQRRGLTVKLYIPPIAYYVLSQCERLSEVLLRTLEVRAALEPFRRAYIELALAEGNDGVSDWEFERLQQHVNAIAGTLLQRFASKTPAHSELHIDTVANDVLDVLDNQKVPELADAIRKEEVSLKGLANLVTNYPLQWAIERWRTRTFRTLFRIGDRFKNATTYPAIVERLWGHALTNEEVARAASYDAAVDAFLKLGEGGQSTGDSSR